MRYPPVSGQSSHAKTLSLASPSYFLEGALPGSTLVVVLRQTNGGDQHREKSDGNSPSCNVILGFHTLNLSPCFIIIDFWPVTGQT